MARVLTEDQENVLDSARRRTTLQATLGDSTELRLATAEIEIGEDVYAAKLAPVDALNLELTGADEGMNLRISNVSLSLGQSLINTPDALDGTSAMLGCYFYDPETEETWHDEKLPGFLETGDIDGDAVAVFFQSMGAKVYYGVSIASLFPDSEIPLEEIPPPAPTPIPTLPGLPTRGGGGRLRLPILEDGRHFLPDELMQI